MKRMILPVIGVLLLQTMHAQSRKEINWEADLDYLSKELSERHYNPFTLRGRDDFLSDINAIKLQSGSLTDFQVAMKTQQSIAQLGDSHTGLDYTKLLDRSKMLPIHLFWMSDGLYIIHTTPGNEKILGCRLLSIGKTPVASIVDSLSSLITADNQAMVKIRIPRLIPSLQILEYFGFTDLEQAELELEDTAGRLIVHTLKPLIMERKNRVSFKPDSLPFSWKYENVLFADHYYPDEKIYHILYNRCSGKEVETKYGDRKKAEKMPSFIEFEQKVFSVLKTKPVDKVIFDMRYNGGGDSSQGTAFIEKLAKLSADKPDMRIYVVTGRATFSSAILNVLDFKRLTNAVLVGEETSGKPNHFGEIHNFQLPGSKLAVYYSTKYFKKTDDDAPTITPDITIEMNFSGFRQGIDPVYEWIKRE